MKIGHSLRALWTDSQLQIPWACSARVCVFTAQQDRLHAIKNVCVCVTLNVNKTKKTNQNKTKQNKTKQNKTQSLFYLGCVFHFPTDLAWVMACYTKDVVYKVLCVCVE